MTNRIDLSIQSELNCNISKEYHFISAIIPIFNEERHLKNLLDSLMQCSEINEIICINDGSQDATAQILYRYQDHVKIIEFIDNQGKGAALAAGLNAARGDIVIFLDADLINLKRKHIHTLVNPIIDQQKRAVVGYCKSSSILPNLTETISGQRAYYKNDLLPNLDEMGKMRFGIELYLNSLFSASDVIYVALDELRGAYKFEKYYPEQAFKEYCREGKEIIYVLPRTILTRKFISDFIQQIMSSFELV